MGGLGKMEFLEHDAWQLKILFLEQLAIFLPNLLLFYSRQAQLAFAW